MEKIKNIIVLSKINKSFANYVKENLTLTVSLPIEDLNRILRDAGVTGLRVNTADEVGDSLEDNFGEISFGVHPDTVATADGKIPSGEDIYHFALEKIGDVLGVSICNMSWTSNNKVSIVFLADGIRTPSCF